MNLNLKGIRITRCEFHNEMGPNTKLNLQVNVNNQIKLPKDMSAESVGTVITKVMVGSPLHPLYLYLEQVSSYADTDEVKGETPDMESMMSLYKTICVPMAMKELEETIKKICAVAKSKKTFSFMRMHVMVKLMYSSGLRVSELVALPENAINYDMRQILICGKGSKERIVPVTKEVISDVLEYLEVRNKFIGNRKSSWMFPSEKSLSGHITRDGFFKSLKKLAAKAGISPEKVHPHILRHSFATRLVNNSADLRSIQKMLGHENIVTTEIYTHITTERLVDEVKKRHPLTQQQKENE